MPIREPCGQDVQAILNPVIGLLAALAAPALVLVVALWLEETASRWQATEIGVLAWLPVIIMGLGIAIAVRFNRARLFAALLNLLAGFAALAWLMPVLRAPTQETLLALAMLFLPLNLLACPVLSDHAAVKGQRLAALLVIGAETLLLLLLAALDVNLSWLNGDFLDFADPADVGLTDTGVLTATVLLVLAFARLYKSPTTQRAALFAAGFCLVLMLANHDQPHSLIAFAAAGGAILVLAVFQETWRIAYVDQLTELPGRRALEEALARLDGCYAIAMVDVDHFKKFNDTYGHDVGDQVLRMVATNLREVGGGGRAYRYGGEEFTILFPGRTVDEAWEFVDQVRAAIADSTFELRRHDRRNGERRTQTSVTGNIQITISAGLAEPSERQQSAGDVIKAADMALYEAKNRGRNRVEKAR